MYTTAGNDETNEFLSVPSSVSVMHVHCVTTSLVYAHIYLNLVDFISLQRTFMKRRAAAALMALLGQLQSELNRR